jgi:hypothetical protein
VVVVLLVVASNLLASCIWSTPQQNIQTVPIQQSRNNQASSYLSLDEISFLCFHHDGTPSAPSGPNAVITNALAHSKSQADVLSIVLQTYRDAAAESEAHSIEPCVSTTPILCEPAT